MYIHRRPSKFALPPRLFAHGSLLPFFSSSSPPSSPYFSSRRSRIFAAPLPSRSVGSSSIRSSAKTCALSPLVSRLLSRELSFVIRLVSNGVSRVRGSSNSRIHVKLGYLPRTTIKPHSFSRRRAAWKLFRGIDYRPFNFRYFFPRFDSVSSCDLEILPLLFLRP